jgi:hypothetical protein
MSYFTRTLFATLLTATLAVGQGLPRLKPGFNFFSKQQDIQLGREAARQVSPRPVSPSGGTPLK